MVLPRLLSSERVSVPGLDVHAGLLGEVERDLAALGSPEAGGALLDGLGGLLQGDEVEAALLLLVLAGHGGDLHLLGDALLHGLGDADVNGLLLVLDLGGCQM